MDPAINVGTFDLTKAIRDRQERAAFKKAVDFTRQAQAAFRAPPGVMTGWHELQQRICAAIDAGFEEGRPQYTDAISIAGALMNMAAGIAGYAVASLPTSYGAHAPTYWEETGKRSLKTFKACMGAALEDQLAEAEKAKADAKSGLPPSVPNDKAPAG